MESYNARPLLEQMKKTLINCILLVVLVQASSYSQSRIKVNEGQSDKALLDNLEKHIKYSTIALENGFAGDLTFEFKINKKQQMSDLKFVKRLYPLCDTEVVKQLLIYQKQAYLKPKKYTISVSFIAISGSDTLNKAAFVKKETKGLYVKVIRQMPSNESLFTF
jgi:hypothetical protein